VTALRDEKAKAVAEVQGLMSRPCSSKVCKGVLGETLCLRKQVVKLNADVATVSLVVVRFSCRLGVRGGEGGVDNERWCGREGGAGARWSSRGERHRNQRIILHSILRTSAPAALPMHS